MRIAYKVLLRRQGRPRIEASIFSGLPRSGAMVRVEALNGLRYYGSALPDALGAAVGPQLLHFSGYTEELGASKPGAVHRGRRCCTHEVTHRGTARLRPWQLDERTNE